VNSISTAFMTRTGSKTNIKHLKRIRCCGYMDGCNDICKEKRMW